MIRTLHIAAHIQPQHAAAQTSFKALVTTDKSGAAQIQTIGLDSPLLLQSPGALVVKVHYSGINYKDGLAVSGKGILKQHPMVAGIDGSGVVESSGDADFPRGTSVILTGWGAGENTPGSFSQFIKCNPAHLVKLPGKSMTLRQSQVLGTAGLTAMLCVIAIMQKTPPSSTTLPIVVSGAAGGVGSISVILLKKLGFRVTAVSGRADTLASKLKAMGADEVIAREAIVTSKPKPLDTERWGGAVDTVGDKTLAAIVSQCARGSVVAACGLAGGSSLNTTVFPFILRGVTLAGIDSVYASSAERHSAWQLLATLLTPQDYDMICDAKTDVGLSGIKPVCTAILSGQVHGHVVVDMSKD